MAVSSDFINFNLSNGKVTWERQLVQSNIHLEEATHGQNYSLKSNVSYIHQPDKEREQ